MAKHFKTKLRYSGVIKDGIPIESLGIEERRKVLAKMPKAKLVDVAVQMSEAINRLWEIYDMEGK